MGNKTSYVFAENLFYLVNKGRLIKTFVLNLGAKQIECVSLEGNFSVFLTDSFVSSVLRENRFEALRIFDVRGRTLIPLTKTTAQRLMHLPKIKELRMSSWNVNDEDFKYLEGCVKRNGWDLHLTKRNFSSSNQ